MVSQELEWKNYPKNMGNRLHTVCSYMAMFPPSVPNHFVRKFSKPNDVVLDPFSGRGTTVLESCILGRTGIGNDKNPLAYLLTASKANVPQKGRISSRINSLERSYNPDKINIKNEDKNIKMIFGDYTLKQLVYLKNKLNINESNVDRFIASMALGILHGNSNGYLSLSMPNTFSMSPNYVKNFISTHKLRRPKRNVFSLLRRKLERCYQHSPIKGKAYHQDARNMTKIKDSSIDLIVTSPPYTRIISYGRFNWIRLWFLNKNAKKVDATLFETQSIPRYTDFMKDVLLEFHRVLKPKSFAVLVIGDVRNRENKKIYNLAQMVLKNSAKPVGFQQFGEIYEDKISDDSKVSRIWGEKRGNATKIDRVLVLEKN